MSDLNGFVEIGLKIRKFLGVVLKPVLHYLVELAMIGFEGKYMKG